MVARGKASNTTPKKKPATVQKRKRRQNHNAAFVVGSALGAAVGAGYALWKTPRDGASVRAGLTGSEDASSGERTEAHSDTRYVLDDDGTTGAKSHTNPLLSKLERALAPIVGVELGRTASGLDPETQRSPATSDSVRVETLRTDTTTVTDTAPATEAAPAGTGMPPAYESTQATGAPPADPKAPETDVTSTPVSRMRSEEPPADALNPDVLPTGTAPPDADQVPSKDRHAQFPSGDEVLEGTTHEHDEPKN